MGKVIAGMTISLDGFIQDRSGSVGALYPIFEALETEQIRLERMKVMEIPAGRTHLRFRIVH